MKTDNLYEQVKLPVTVILAVKNERSNLQRCLDALKPAQYIYVVDSNSTDGTIEFCLARHVSVIQFDYRGGYPKKRQWALENLNIVTPWVLLLDADEIMTEELWGEMRFMFLNESRFTAFLIRKEFHFLGRRFNYGGFSHCAILLFRKGCARFENLVENDPSGLDMEVHERLIVDGPIGRLCFPVLHEDFKGLELYVQKHEKYSTWEAVLRRQYLKSGIYGKDSIRSRFFGSGQERRRFLKKIVMRIPGEPFVWFVYHYIFLFGFLEGKAGWVACRIRASYIAQVRAKIREFKNAEQH